MITHEIKKNKPGRIQQIAHGIYEFWRQPYQQQQQQAPYIKNLPGIGAPSGLDDDIHDRPVVTEFMSKEEFNKYLNFVSLRYKKGDYVTMRMYPIILERTMGPPIWEIDFIQEMRHLVHWDNAWKEPRVIGLKSKYGTGIGIGPSYQFVAPMSIRPLHESEKRFVNVSNTETQNPAN